MANYVDNTAEEVALPQVPAGSACVTHDGLLLQRIRQSTDFINFGPIDNTSPEQYPRIAALQDLGVERMVILGDDIDHIIKTS